MLKVPGDNLSTDNPLELLEGLLAVSADLEASLAASSSCVLINKVLRPKQRFVQAVLDSGLVNILTAMGQLYHQTLPVLEKAYTSAVEVATEVCPPTCPIAIRIKTFKELPSGEIPNDAVDGQPSV